MFSKRAILSVIDLLVFGLDLDDLDGAGGVMGMKPGRRGLSGLARVKLCSIQFSGSAC